MNSLMLISCIVVAGLFIYLIAALIHPEDFS